MTGHEAFHLPGTIVACLGASIVRGQLAQLPHSELVIGVEILLTRLDGWWWEMASNVAVGGEAM